MHDLTGFGHRLHLLSFLFLLMQNVRQFGKCILEQVSNTRGLGCSLKFLCSNIVSLSAVYLGLRHALKLVSVNLFAGSCKKQSQHSALFSFLVYLKMLTWRP